MERGSVEEEKGMLWGFPGLQEGAGGNVKGGREAVWGETTLTEGGLVGERKLGGNGGGEFVHCSTCSGLMEGLEGLVGRASPPPGWEERDGEVVEMFVGVLVLSLGPDVSVALDWGLLAVLLPPGELAVAVLPSPALDPPSVVAAAFSAFRHFALRF